MQKIAFIALLAGSLLAGPGSVFSQSPLPGTGLPAGKMASGWEKSLQLPPMPVYSHPGKLFFPGKWDARNYRPFDPYSEMSITPMMDSVRILSPDKMRCRMADLSRLEKMPVMRLQNLRPRDPMPDPLLRGQGDGVRPIN